MEYCQSIHMLCFTGAIVSRNGWSLLNARHVASLFAMSMLSAFLFLAMAVLYQCILGSLGGPSTTTAGPRTRTKPCSLSRQRIGLLFWFSLITGPCCALMMGRIHWLEWFGPFFFSLDGYQILPAKKCCLAATIYPYQTISPLISWLLRHEAMTSLLEQYYPMAPITSSPPASSFHKLPIKYPHVSTRDAAAPGAGNPPPLKSLYRHAIDLAIHRWTLGEEETTDSPLPGGRLEPNLVQHIGLYSSLSRQHMPTEYRLEDLREQWYIHTHGLG